MASGLERRGFLVGMSVVSAAALGPLSGCANGLGGFSFVEAVRRLLTLSSLSALDRLTGPGGFYDEQVVPESRRLARGALGRQARIDFKRPKPPLLLIAGEQDHIIPASLNRTNWQRYRASPSITDVHEFPGRDHYLLGAPGWQEVADHALDWAVNVQQRANATPATAQSVA